MLVCQHCRHDCHHSADYQFGQCLHGELGSANTAPVSSQVTVLTNLDHGEGLHPPWPGRSDHSRRTVRRRRSSQGRGVTTLTVWILLSHLSVITWMLFLSPCLHQKTLCNVVTQFTVYNLHFSSSQFFSPLQPICMRLPYSEPGTARDGLHGLPPAFQPEVFPVHQQQQILERDNQDMQERFKVPVSIGICKQCKKFYSPEVWSISLAWNYF